MGTGKCINCRRSAGFESYHGLCRVCLILLVCQKIGCAFWKRRSGCEYVRNALPCRMRSVWNAQLRNVVAALGVETKQTDARS